MISTRRGVRTLSIAALASLYSCSGGVGQARYESAGSAAKGDVKANSADGTVDKDPAGKRPQNPSTPDDDEDTKNASGGGRVSTNPPTSGGMGGSGSGGSATGTSTGSGAGTGTGTGSGSGGGTSASTSGLTLALDACTAKKEAWSAVSSGKITEICTKEPLVPWCCTQADVKAQFPKLAAELEKSFQQIIDKDRMVLYHCSIDATGGPGSKAKYTMHLGKILGSTITYQTISVTGATPSGAPASANPCPVIKGDDLKI